MTLSSTPLSITLAGRDKHRGKAALVALNAHAPSSTHSFETVDLFSNSSDLTALISDHDAVVHTAGPFQFRPDPLAVLRAAREARVPYLDVSDDLAHSTACRAEAAAAKAAGHVALVSTGIYPGVGNLMAAAAAHAVGEPTDLRLYYHTAGSGGIGPTVLATTFHLLAEPALQFENGRRVVSPPASGVEPFDFGPRVGTRDAYLLCLPEVASLHEHVAPMASISARFSTAPSLWNVLLQAMPRLIPSTILQNRKAMDAFARFSIPIVQAVDRISGARTVVVARADASGRRVDVRYEHESLAPAVGQATAAFALELLRVSEQGDDIIPPGVFYPEELSDSVRKRILANSTRTCDLFETIQLDNI